MSTQKNAVRVTDDKKDILNYNDFIEDLKFQIREDYNTLEEYEEYKSSYDSDLPISDFYTLKFDNLVNVMNNGYAIFIMGDTYYFE